MIFIVLIILTSKLVLKSFSLIKFFLFWKDFHSSEWNFKCRSQQFCSLWFSYLQWMHFNLFWKNFNFLSSNWVIILLKLKFFSWFDRLSWSTKAIVISLINSLNLLILMLCIKSKMYNSKLSLRFKRKRLLNIHDFTVFSMFAHLIIIYLSKSA